MVEEIDRPGEWAVDFENSRLYWWPSQGWQQGEICLNDRTAPIIRFDRASYIRVEGLALKHSLAHGFKIRDSHGIEVAGCQLRNLSSSGVVVQRGEANTVRSCDIRELGQSGIVASDGGDTIFSNVSYQMQTGPSNRSRLHK